MEAGDRLGELDEGWGGGWLWGGDGVDLDFAAEGGGCHAVAVWSEGAGADAAAVREDGGEGFAGFEVPGPGFEAVVATGEEDAAIVA